MARGWESKDVDSQIEDRKNVTDTLTRAQKKAEEMRKESEKRGLALSRVRIVNDLGVATNPNHRKSLEAALAHLDKKIAELS
jgi:urease accessory protein UreF